MTTSPLSFVHSVLADGGIQVEIWAAAGSNLITADLGLSYSGAVFSSAQGASGWSVQANASSSTALSVAMFDGSFANPVGDASQERLITLLFTPIVGAARVEVAVATAVVSTTASEDQALIVPAPLSVSLSVSSAASIAADGTGVLEGNSGSTSYIFTATRTGDTSTAQTANWSVAGSGSNAATAADFVGGVLPTGTVSFGIGETSKTINVQVAGDTSVETDEGFTITLSNASTGLVLGTSTATGTIINDDALVSIAATSANKAEGNTGTTSYTFAAIRTGDTSTAQTANWAVAGSGSNAAVAADFVGNALPSNTLTFGIGETSKTITVEVAGDTSVETDEGFAVTLSNPSTGLVLGTASATSTIINDDAAVSLVATSASKAEGQSGITNYTFTATRTGDSSVAHTANWAVAGSGSNAAIAEDFVGGVLPTGTVTFGIGETSKVITIEVAGDTSVENDEGFTVTLSSPSTGLVLGTASATGTIVNDDSPTVSVFAASAATAEGNSGTTNYTFTVSLGQAPLSSQSIAWAVSGSGTNAAIAGDFVGGALPTGTVSLGIGETSKTITIAVAGDTSVETDEGFTVTLSNPSTGLVLGTSAATGTIINDDALVSIAATSASKAEGNTGTTSYTFTATRTGDTSTAQTANWTVAGSGSNAAIAGDFVGGVLPTGTVSFGIGETSKTITVEVAGDTSVETDEGFTVTLSNASTGLVLGTSTATGTIINDDALVSIAATSANKAEGNTGSTSYTFTATRTGDTSSTHTAAWSVAGSGSNAAIAGDFVGGALPTGTVSFGIGDTSKTITIDVAGDTSVETNEGFTVSLSNASAGLVLGTSTASGSIVNDDLANVPTEGADTLTGTPQADTLAGLGGGDSLTGLAGDDALNGGVGADTLTGGAGNDTLEGGTDADLALFSSTQSAYRFAFDGNMLIVSGPDGTDRLSNVEALTFGGATPVLVSNLQGVEPLVTVQTAGVITKFLPDRYVGPVSWLEYQTLGSPSGDVVIGTSRNDFINLSGGDDAANGGAGDDVLDGGTGSNFLTGGAGRDDFFLDGRGGSTTWATITDWEAGERLSVWGWRPGVSQATWVDSAGAEGWMGVTMHGDLDNNGVIDTSVTWTGRTRGDLPTPLQYEGIDLLWFT